MKRYGWKAAVPVVVAVAAMLALTRSRQPVAGGGDEARAQTGPGIAAQVAAVTEEPVTGWLEATGSAAPEFEAQLSAKVMGRVAAVNAREGDPVRRGQVLVQLDARDLDAGVAQAGAGLRSAAIGYDTAKVAARMEEASSAARIATAQAQVTQCEAGVKAAQARLDAVTAGPRRQEREQSQLAVNQARANLGLADTNLRRYRRLSEEGAVSRQQFDQAQTQADVARAQMETAQQALSLAQEGSRSEDVRAAQEGLSQARAALSQAHAGLKQAQAGAMQVAVRRQEILGAAAQVGQSRASLQLASATRGYAAIAAPFDGVVSARLADPGAMASPGVPLLKVQGGQIRLQAVVPETAVKAARPGAQVAVRVDALGGRDVMGRVVEIGPQGDPSSHTFIVKIGLPAGSGVRAGMFGRARFVTGTQRCVRVPAAAILDRQGLSYVYVVDEAGTARLRIVTLGEQASGRAQVLSGLNPGERVAISNIGALSDGAKVSAE